MHRVARLIEFVIGLVMLLFIALLLFNVITRYVFSFSYIWISDLVAYLFIWLVYIGVIAVTLESSHLAMDALYMRFPPGMQQVVQKVVSVVGFALTAFMTWLAWNQALLVAHMGVTSPSGAFVEADGYFALPIGLGATAIAFLLTFRSTQRKEDQI